MLTELCAELHNYFCRHGDIHFGKYTISGGSFTTPLDFLQDGQYFRIAGSVFNDGIYQHPASGLTDEAFKGSVWAMKVPPSFVALSERIDKFNKELQNFVANSPKYASESYPNGYSYSALTDLPTELRTEGQEIDKEKALWRKIR